VKPGDSLSIETTTKVMKSNPRVETQSHCQSALKTKAQFATLPPKSLSIRCEDKSSICNIAINFVIVCGRNKVVSLIVVRSELARTTHLCEKRATRQSAFDE